MRKEDNSPQGKIVTELLQVLAILTLFNLTRCIFFFFLHNIQKAQQDNLIVFYSTFILKLLLYLE